MGGGSAGKLHLFDLGVLNFFLRLLTPFCTEDYDPSEPLITYCFAIVLQF